MRKSILLALSAGLLSEPVLACEPCAQSLTLQQTADQAGLIIMGTRTTPVQPNEKMGEGGPEYIMYDVQAVLKGQYGANAIKILGWQSMCDYGVVVEPERPYVIFLTKQAGSDYYKPLNNGCSVKAMRLSSPYDPADYATSPCTDNTNK